MAAKAFTEHDHLITHLNCMDGAGCATIFRLNGGRKENVHFSSPAHERTDVAVRENRKQFGGRLFLADVSVSLDCAQELDERDDILLFDHHKTAIPLADFSWCTVDVPNKRCGSRVFLDYVENQNGKLSDLGPLIEAIDDRDRWINHNEHSADLSELFSILEQEPFIERCMQYGQPQLLPEEKVAVKFERARRMTYIDKLRPIVQTREGHKIGFVSCDQRYTSDAGHHLCDKHGLDCCVLVNPSTISLRAPEHSPLDLSVIAKKYGGGGHRCASGFSIKALFDKPLIDLVMERFDVV